MNINGCNILGFVPVAHCTANWRSSRNSKLSFPSGHAFAAVFCTLFLFFYLRGVQKRHPGDAILKIFFWAVNCISALFTIYCCNNTFKKFNFYNTGTITPAFLKVSQGLPTVGIFLLMY
jgi:hypothetical protein